VRVRCYILYYVVLYQNRRPQLTSSQHYRTERRESRLVTTFFRRESARGGGGGNEVLFETKVFFCGRGRSDSTIDCRLFGTMCGIWESGLSWGVTIEEVLDVGDLEVIWRTGVESWRGILSWASSLKSWPSSSSKPTPARCVALCLGIEPSFALLRRRASRFLVRSQWSTYFHVFFCGVFPVGTSGCVPYSTSFFVVACTDSISRLRLLWWFNEASEKEAV